MPELAFKPEVRVNAGHFRHQVRWMLDVALLTAPPTVDGLVWATSANDGNHKKGSRHYTDEAWDLRCWNVEEDGGPGVLWSERPIAKQRVQAWARSIQSELGPDYDVVYEEKTVTLQGGRSVQVPHIHVEYDPVLGRRA